MLLKLLVVICHFATFFIKMQIAQERQQKMTGEYSFKTRMHSVGCVLTTAVAATRCQYLRERGLLGVCLEGVCLGDGALHREGVCLEGVCPGAGVCLEGVCLERGLPRGGGGLPRRVCLGGSIQSESSA